MNLFNVLLKICFPILYQAIKDFQQITLFLLVSVKEIHLKDRLTTQKPQTVLFCL